MFVMFGAGGEPGMASPLKPLDRAAPTPVSPVRTVRNSRPLAPSLFDGRPRGRTDGSTGLFSRPDGRMAVIGLLRAARPAQWPKNLLVLIAPLAAGTITDPAVRTAGMLAVLAFTFAAAGTYLLNDVADRAADARHPTKCRRPIAAGEVSPAVAAGTGVALLALSMALPAAAHAGSVALVIVAYLGLTGIYNLGAKRIALVELGLVAAFYVLRVAAGAVATGAPLPAELAAAVSCAALCLVVGKRESELTNLGPRTGTRSVLASYSHDGLSDIRRTAAVVGLVGYALWAMSQADANPWGPWLVLSIPPAVLGIQRYELLVEDGAAERPDAVVWSDGYLRVMGLAAGAIVCLGIYGG
jgi:decaprenyl-phosphate phosphoribosyltransferase